MAKTKKDNPISLELDKFEKNIKQYQTYLETYNLLNIEDPSERHKEITAQNSIMTLLPNWLKGLKELREASDKAAIETRGGVEINAGWKVLKERNE